MRNGFLIRPDYDFSQRTELGQCHVFNNFEDMVDHLQGHFQIVIVKKREE